MEALRVQRLIHEQLHHHELVHRLDDVIVGGESYGDGHSGAAHVIFGQPRH